MADGTNSPAAESTPGRRRGVHSWARRHPQGAGVLTLLSLLLILRLTWGWYAARQAAAALDDLRRRGEPVRLINIVIEPLPDAENAWPVYMAARAAIKPGVDSPRASAMTYPNYPPYGAGWVAMARASEQGNAAMFPLARRARQLPRAQLRRDLSTATTISPSLNGARHLANTLADGAAYVHQQGDDAEAVERLLDLLHLAASIRQDPTLLSQLVAIGIDSLACSAIGPIAADLKLDGRGAAPPARARALIDALLDETAAREGFTRSLTWERAIMLDFLDAESRGTWAIRPLADRTRVRWLHDFDVITEASKQPTFAAARRVMARAHPETQLLTPARPLLGAVATRLVPRYSRWFEQYSLRRALEQIFRVYGERRVMAVILAARLYRHDHGRWPADLAALAPRYLPGVPTDPFPDDGRPLGYMILHGALPDGGDRPLVYFEAGEAEGAVIRPVPMNDWEMNPTPGRRGVPIRQYRDLSLWVPKAPLGDGQGASSPEAVDDEPDVADAPRDDAEQDEASTKPAQQ